MSFGASRNAAMTDDESLARQAGSEAAAFAELYERYLQPVQRYVRTQVPDHATAEDLTAQIFVKTFESAGSYRGDGSYRAWIFQIARNTISSWRASKKRSEIPVETIADGSLVDDPLAAPPVEQDDLVLATIAELPSAQREVVAMHYWRDLSIDEIARATRRSTGAVRQLLHRARNRLRKRLSPKDISALAGAATGASALAYYSIKRHRSRKR